jgi:hypothetical protein
VTADAIPEDADLQRMDALRRDLRAASERAIAAGAKPSDVILCMGLVLGALAHNMSPSPPDSIILSYMRGSLSLGRQEEAENKVSSGLQMKVYGGEARRRRR